MCNWKFSQRYWYVMPWTELHSIIETFQIATKAETARPSEMIMSVHKCPRYHIPEDIMAIEMFSYYVHYCLYSEDHGYTSRIVKVCWYVLWFFFKFFSLALQPGAGYGLLVHEVSWSHTTTPTVVRTPLDEWSAHRRNLYLTTHNRQTSMPLVGFVPTIAVGEGRRATP
jgi:hypothetical protein